MLTSVSSGKGSLILPPRITSEVYRGMVKASDLTPCKIQIKETDLLVSGDRDLKNEATTLVKRYRRQIENYIEKHPSFTSSFSPIGRDPFAPRIVNSMIEAGLRAGVGPMASVAGAIAEYVGLGLMQFSRDVIVENGGDIFFYSKARRKILLLAESSDFSDIEIAIQPSSNPIGICTSSGKLGHSTSYGRTDAVMILAPTPSIADATATAIANAIKKSSDIQQGLKMAGEIGVLGVLILIDGHMGAWGRIEFCE